MKLDRDLCVAEGNLLFYDAYRSADIASMYIFSLNLQSLVTMHDGNFEINRLYKHFYQLVVFLLTLTIKFASCERAHSKLDIVKFEVRTSMNSEIIGRFHADLLKVNSYLTVVNCIS